MATWEAAFLGWTWEAFEKEDDEGLYYGRVSSPLTYHTWEYGYFTEEQLRTAGAYRTDVEVDDNEELFPDGGYREDSAQVKLYETELNALLEDRGGES